MSFSQVFLSDSGNLFKYLTEFLGIVEFARLTACNRATRKYFACKKVDDFVNSNITTVCKMDCATLACTDRMVMKPLGATDVCYKCGKARLYAHMELITKVMEKKKLKGYELMCELAKKAAKKIETKNKSNICSLINKELKRQYTLAKLKKLLKTLKEKKLKF